VVILVGVMEKVVVGGIAINPTKTLFGGRIDRNPHHLWCHFGGLIIRDRDRVIWWPRSVFRILGVHRDLQYTYESC